ncbi:MAG: hypothetical protein ACXACW_11280 [Candidatus Hodarchaeales archaeon]|jgi:hypothetical protein
MNVRRIYNLEDIEDEDYKTPKWCNHEAFWEIVYREINQDDFNYSDAENDERVKIHLKASAEVETDNKYMVSILEYIAISFDSNYVGLVVGFDGSFGWVMQDVYITNYLKYQAMLAYVKTMYQNPPEQIIGETVKVEDLDGRFGFVIDKRYKNNMRKEEK